MQMTLEEIKLVFADTQLMNVKLTQLVQQLRQEVATLKQRLGDKETPEQ